MPVVLRGITIWTFYALVSCASVAVCLSVEDVVRWELMFGPSSPAQRRYDNNNNNNNNNKRNGVVEGMAAIESPAACTCTPDPEYEYLGPGHYPSEVMSAKCTGSQWCAEVKYSVLVLRETAAVTRRQHEPRPELVPAGLRGRWTFVEFSVVAGCSCPSS